MSLYAVHIELEDANALVTRWHRHLGEVPGHRFSIGAVLDGELVGAVIVGDRKGRGARRKGERGPAILEVNRLVTNGTKNACSFLYGAAARAAKAMGYLKIQTYILEEETGVSLKAAGWVHEADIQGRAWKHTDGRPRANLVATSNKGRWAKVLNEPAAFSLPVCESTQQQEALAL